MCVNVRVRRSKSKIMPFIVLGERYDSRRGGKDGGRGGGSRGGGARR